MLKRGFAVIAVALILVSAAGAFGPGRFGLMPTLGPVATVEGGVIPCSQARSAHPQYGSATVEIRDYTNLDPFFSPAFATQKVEANGVYRFVVDPGVYLLSSRGGGIALARAGDGQDVRADIREPCLPPAAGS